MSRRRTVDCLSEAVRAPVLARGEELTLARRYKNDHDREAADTLARAHLRCVVTIARRYRGYGVSLGELIAEGNFGIAQALTKFDPERGVRFATYATHWIRACILNRVLKSWSLLIATARSAHERQASARLPALADGAGERICNG